jgi:hypothetical protein
MNYAEMRKFVDTETEKSLAIIQEIARLERWCNSVRTMVDDGMVFDASPEQLVHPLGWKATPRQALFIAECTEQYIGELRYLLQPITVSHLFTHVKKNP